MTIIEYTPKRIASFKMVETDPCQTLERAERNLCLYQAMNKLTIQEQRVVTLLYGFLAKGSLSRVEVSAELSISPQRVYQLEKSALRKLRLHMKINY
ncbi:sigma factor-like helix-turn-helix DNA-binding protein [Alkalicoccus saliphilus]|uniref:RNA polymerase sigma-70 domain-containing protein n=1 Tax=Alkalicoccus saliphilus TaxID=200989 RepID=A0A2T4U1Z0_9BACI|nr:sigma factor-like helix-turn-helix DNA-binding protein [Alkalicoccus saliphilus]PTL37406.1 hypothetical protein C6Y45_16630 [Alkalicoccus saliphilus]